MAVWRLTIDDWQPARLNELLGHWARAARRKRFDRDLISLECQRQGVPKATGQRRVSLEVTLTPRQRGTDTDSFWKSTLDALVACGRLVDDRALDCVLGSVTFTRGPRKRTVIVLEDVEE